MRRAAARRQGRRREFKLYGISGEAPALYPGFIEPCLATQREQVPARGQWSYDIKHDGSPYSQQVTPLTCPTDRISR
jgi:hypothetical protein